MMGKLESPADFPEYPECKFSRDFSVLFKDFSKVHSLDVFKDYVLLVAETHGLVKTDYPLGSKAAQYSRFTDKTIPTLFGGIEHCLYDHLALEFRIFTDVYGTHSTRTQRLYLDVLSDFLRNRFSVSGQNLGTG